MGEYLGATMPDVLLGVDLGTSNTVAVVRWRAGRTRPLLFDGACLLPSAVFADPSGRLVVGTHAQRLAGLDPARFEPNPKRRIDEPTVLLGSAEVPSVDLLAALLAAVAQAAVEAVGFLPQAVLTFPAAWGPHRRAALAEAARRAGWPPAQFVAEPVAAARYFSDILRQPVPMHGYLGVFDFGGGTLDIAVVRNEGGEAGQPRFAVIGSGGLPDLGGLDIDAALVNRVGATLETRHPQVWKAICEPSDAADRRLRTMFWNDVRSAKEMLSRATSAPIIIPGHDDAIYLTRDELDEVAQPLLRRATTETAEVIGRCGIRPDQLTGLFLVGGSSRLPLVSRMLHSELGIAPTVLEQPELPVAEGSLAELAPRLWGPVQPDPTSCAPTSPAVAPRSPAPMAQIPPPVRRRWYRRTGVVAGIAAAVLVAVTVTSAVLLLRDQSTTLEFVAPMEDGPTLEIVDSTYSTDLLTAVRGDRAYVGLADEGQLRLAALDLAEGTTAWDLRTVDATAGEWVSLSAIGQALVLRAESSGDRPGLIVVCDPDTGEVRWQREIDDTDSLVFSSSALILGSDEDATTYALSWSDGSTRWSEPNPVDGSTTAAVTTFTTVTTDDLTRPSDLTKTIATFSASDSRPLLQLTNDQQLLVRDMATGELDQTLSGLGGSSSLYLAFDDTFYTTGVQGNRVEAFDLNSTGTPTVVYQGESGDSIEQILPQEGGRILLVVSRQTVDRVISVDLDGNSVVWEKELESVTKVVPIGDHVFVKTSGDAGSLLLDADGQDRLAADYQDSVGVRVGDGALMLFTGVTMGASATDLSLTGITMDPFVVTPLGSWTVAGSTCSWSTQYLVCATETEFRTWRFAQES